MVSAAKDAKKWSRGISRAGCAGRAAASIPFIFAILHLLFWPVKIFVDRLCSWWCILAEVVLMASFLHYNYSSLKIIMYVS